MLKLRVPATTRAVAKDEEDAMPNEEDIDEEAPLPMFRD